MRKLFKLSGEKTDRITVPAVMEHDIAPWLFAILIMSLLYTGIIWVVTDGSSDPTKQLLAHTAVSGVSLYILGLFGTLIAVREKGKWLWITFAISLFLYIFKSHLSETLIQSLTGNTLLEFMLIVIMLLSIGRVIEYINLHYNIKLEEPTMSISGWITYIVVAAVCLVMTNPLIGEWVICSTTNCNPL